MRRLSDITTWLKVGLLTTVIGCGSSDQVSIKGRVTFDGHPVGPGSIVFIPETGNEGIKVAAPIEDGKYEIGADRGTMPGVFRVEISWSKKTGRQIPSGDPGIMMDESQEAIPPEYNTQSTLNRELKPGENIHDFALQTQ